MKIFTFCGLSNLRIAAKNKEETVKETTAVKVVFIFHRPAEALKLIDPLERIE